MPNSSDIFYHLLTTYQSTTANPSERTDGHFGAGRVRSPGVFDRLIADGYTHAGMETLTLDRQMAQLSGVNRL